MKQAWSVSGIFFHQRISDLLRLARWLIGAFGRLFSSALSSFLSSTAGGLQLLLTHDFLLSALRSFALGAFGGVLLSFHGGFPLTFCRFLLGAHGRFALTLRSFLLGFHGGGLLLRTHGEFTLTLSGFLLLAFHDGGALAFSGFLCGLHGCGFLLTLQHDFLLTAGDFFLGGLLLGHGGFAGLECLHLGLLANHLLLTGNLHFALLQSLGLRRCLLLPDHGGFA